MKKASNLLIIIIKFEILRELSKDTIFQGIHEMFGMLMIYFASMNLSEIVLVALMHTFHT